MTRDKLRDELIEIIRDAHGGHFGEADAILAIAGKAAVEVVEEWIKGEIDGIKRPRTRAENIAALRELFGVKEL